MIWQKSVSDYVIQSIILGQPLFWMWLHDTDISFHYKLNYVFNASAITFMWGIWVINVKIGYYTPFLIMQYVAHTVLAVYIFNQRFNLKEAVCLGFLIVFLNSYYWELPLHLAEFLSGPPHIGMIVQLWRLIPLPFLLNQYRFKPNARAIISLGLGFSALIMVLKFLLKIPLPNIYILNRLVCLFLLIKVLVEANKKIVL